MRGPWAIQFLFFLPVDDFDLDRDRSLSLLLLFFPFSLLFPFPLGFSFERPRSFDAPFFPFPFPSPFPCPLSLPLPLDFPRFFLPLDFSCCACGIVGGKKALQRQVAQEVSSRGGISHFIRLLLPFPVLGLATLL